MKRQTIEAILEHFCNEARNSAHTIFGAVDLLKNTESGDERFDALQRGVESTDRMLRTIDDLRELVSRQACIPAPPQPFNLNLCLVQIVDGLNRASARRARHIVIAASDEMPLFNQDAMTIEHALLRVLDTTYKLAVASEVRVSLARVPQKRAGADATHSVDDKQDAGGLRCPRVPHRDVARLTVAARDSGLAQKLAGWLNDDAEGLELQAAGEVPFAAAIMVAGRRLRALNASAETVIDKAGHGELTIEIPQCCAGDEEASGPAPSSDRQWQTLNILIVEDCDESYALSELMLDHENVSRARDGLEAIHLVKRRRLDIIFMDIHMPGLDGYSTIREIREWETQTGNAHTPIVILSSDDIDVQRSKAAQSGCNGFLRKPLSQPDLTRFLAKLREFRCSVA